jgi:hypothetical protein
MAQKTICQISAAVPALDGQSNSLAAEPIAVRKDSGDRLVIGADIPPADRGRAASVGPLGLMTKIKSRSGMQLQRASDRVPNL